jgi:gliding motility-associated lipoprotein GldH
MFRLLPIAFLGLAFAGCDSSRVYENNHDFANAIWSASDTAVFQIPIEDTTHRYNVILNIRNSIDFETVRLFVDYSLITPGNQTIRKRLVEQILFDKKTGEPFGDSGLGNIYEHHVLLEPSITFPVKGIYTVKLNQMMRTDSLSEILSAGIRAEIAQ